MGTRDTAQGTRHTQSAPNLSGIAFEGKDVVSVVVKQLV